MDKRIYSYNEIQELYPSLNLELFQEDTYFTIFSLDDLNYVLIVPNYKDNQQKQFTYKNRYD